MALIFWKALMPALKTTFVSMGGRNRARKCMVGAPLGERRGPPGRAKGLGPQMGSVPHPATGELWHLG